MQVSNQHPHYDTARLNAVSFTTLAEHYGTVVKRGSALFTICPWHEDKHPSLALYDEAPHQRSHCHCFACGKTASPIDFVMQHEGCTFQQACEIIGRLFGIYGDSPTPLPYRKVKPIELATPKEYTYIPMDYVEQHLSAENSFCVGLRYLFDPALVLHLTEEYRLGCLFGAHLLPRYPTAPVILVESPKNALVGACAYPEFLWVATGNKGMLKRSVLSPLRGRIVVVYPDRDAINEWEEKLQHMQDIAPFRVSRLCEHVAPDDQSKYDIADYIISCQLA